MMNVYRIINSLSVGICPIFFNHGVGFQSPIPFMSKTSPSPLFSNKDLVRRFGIRHAGQNKMTIQFAYVPYVYISKFLEGE